MRTQHKSSAESARHGMRRENELLLSTCHRWSVITSPTTTRTLEDPWTSTAR